MAGHAKNFRKTAGEKPEAEANPAEIAVAVNSIGNLKQLMRDSRSQTVIRLPAYEAVKDDPILYAHASRVMHGETNPGNARPLIQQHESRQVWINPPPIP